MSRYISAGIDIGTHNTRVIIAEAEKSHSREFSIIGSGVAESRGLRHGYIINTKDAIRGVKEAVRKAEQSAGISVKRALISLGGISLESETNMASVIISRVDGEVTDTDVTRAIDASEGGLKLANKKIIHRFPLGFKLDNKEVLGRPQGMRGIKLEARVFFVTCLDQHLDDFIHTIESAGVEVEDVVASPLAASLVLLTKLQRTAGCVLSNIGAETVSLAVFENDQIISLEVFPIGSTDITNDIALGLKIPLDEAEDIKKKKVSSKDFPQKKLDDIIEARLNDVFDLIEAHLKKLGRNELLPAGIILTGGGAGLATIEDLARGALRLPARVVVPHSFLNVNGSSLDTSWSVAYGLCILGFDNSYASDLSQINRIKVRGYVRGFKEWLRQFLP